MLLRALEGRLRTTARETPDLWRPRGRAPPPGHDGHGHHGGHDDAERAEYVVDAAPLEPLFDAFLDAAREHLPYADAREGRHAWHQKASVIVVNPSKPRANPKGTAADAHHRPGNLVELWAG